MYHDGHKSGAMTTVDARFAGVSLVCSLGSVFRQCLVFGIWVIIVSLVQILG